MSFVVRGARNAFRNGLRTSALVAILALSLGLAMTMLLARQAVETKITSVKSSIGNTISVTPAGARGFAGGGTPLTTDQVATIKSIAHVASVQSSLTDQLTTSNSSLTSAIEAGELGERRGEQNEDSTSSSSNSANEGAQADSTGSMGPMGGGGFTPSITALGSTDVLSLAAISGDTATLTSGTAFAADSTDNVALVGDTLAEANSLTVGSTFTAYDTTITVVGIFDSGDTFGGNAVIFPLSMLQTLSDQAGDITSVTVTADSVDNTEAVTTALKSKLGDAADVTSAQDTAETAIEPLSNIATITLYSLLGAVASAAVIIFLMMLMVVRERRREIGVYKALGTSNGKIVAQFMAEALVLTLVGAVIGMIIGIIFGNSVTDLLVTATSNSSSTASGMGGGMGRMSGGFGGALSAGRQALSGIETTVGWPIIAAGLGGAVLVALIGSAIPAYLTARVRPAEVMRGE